MSFLKRTIQNAVSRGISKGISDAVGKAVQQVVEPKATQYANQAADRLDQAAGNAAQQTRQASSGLEGALSNLERSMQGYATEAAKNMKVCPGCSTPTTADKTFCPQCGAKLPEQTVAQGAVCPSCGKQNTLAIKFCQDCGAKLPATIAVEQAQADRDAAVMAQWDQYLSHYPKWNCGGCEFDIEEYDPGCFEFRVCFNGNEHGARRAVDAYRQLLLQNGFRQAGEYPGIEDLYKMENGVCYHVGTGMCFECSSDCPSIAFDISEPRGGFHYVKPEPRKKTSLKDLLGF